MSNTEKEKCRMKHESGLAHYNAITAWRAEGFRSVNIAGQAAIKSAILINGGAAIALLAFIGSIYNASQSTEVATQLTYSMRLFIIGVSSGAIASGTTYISQLFYATEYKRLAHVLNGISWLLVTSCYVLFVLGALGTHETFLSRF